MNKHNIYGVQYGTKLHPFSDISKIFPNKNPTLFHSHFENPLFSKTSQVLENGIFNFHNFPKLSRTRMDPASSSGVLQIEI